MRTALFPEAQITPRRLHRWLSVIVTVAAFTLATPGVGASEFGVSQIDAAPATVGCTVLTEDIAAPAMLPDLVSIVATSVDASGVVYALWYGQPEDSFELDSFITATEPDGTTRLLLRSGDVISGLPLGLVHSLAAAPLSGDLYVNDDNRERVIRRTADGDLSTVIDTTDMIDGVPYRGARFLKAFANDTVVAGMYGTAGPAAQPVTIAFFSANGPGVDWERTVASSAMQTLNSIDVTGAGEAPIPNVFVNDAAFNRLHRIDGVTEQIDTVLSYSALTVDGFAVRLVLDVVVDGADLLMLLSTDNGEYLVRRSADATMTIIFDPVTPLGDEGEPPSLVSGVHLDPHGDIYVTGADRVIRIPESGNCLTPRPDRVQVAGSVNCDGQLDIIDALVIAQYDAAVRSPRYSCPLVDPAREVNPAAADVNGDGRVDVIDALTVAVCVAGGANLACP